MKNLVLANGHMNIKVIACIGDNALLQRTNDESFIVVNGLHIHNDFTCDWNFAYGYFEKYNEAFICFNNKILKPFAEYEDVARV